MQVYERKHYNGKLKSSWSYVGDFNGLNYKRQGLQIYWYENGKVRIKFFMHNNSYKGIHIYNNEIGNRNTIRTCRNGFWQGLGIKFEY